MPSKWDYSEYFDKDGNRRHGLSKKPSFLGRIWRAIKRLVAFVNDFVGF